MQSLAIDDFARAFGIDELPRDCTELVGQHDFRYEYPTPREHEKLVLETLKKLDGNQFSVVGKHRKDVWEKGWAENLRDFVASNYDPAALRPKYYGANPFLRFRQRYVRPIDASFELNFFTVLRTWLYRRYLAEVEDIYELGCGTGLNLILLAKLFPEKNLHGTDWAAASIEILEGLAKKYGWRLKGHPLDFFQPDASFKLAPGSAVLTMDALEQVGANHGGLLEYLLSQKPAVCIHVEPVVELYEDDNLLDYLAIRYHRQRGYLDNYLSALRELEAKQRIEILLTRRTYFGGFYNESYSIVVWKPR